MKIKQYGYKPTTKFETLTRGTGPRLYIGVELELDARPDDYGYTNTARRINQLWKNTGFRHKAWYPKHDGSLNSGGVELVSHPRTLEAWKEYGPSDLAAIRENFTAPERGYGLHAHVGRIIYFHGVKETLNAPWIRRITQTLDEPFIVATCRRYNSLFARMRLPDENAYEYNRYTFVNSTPDHTVEFRGGAATTRDDRFFTYIEFVHSVTMFSLSVTDRMLVKRNVNFQRAYYNFVLQHQVEYSNLYAATRHLIATVEPAHVKPRYKNPRPIVSTRMAFKCYTGRRRARLLAPIVTAVRAASQITVPSTTTTGV